MSTSTSATNETEGSATADLAIAIEITGKDTFSGVLGGVQKGVGGLLGGFKELGLGIFGITQTFDLAKGAIEGLIGPAIEAQQVATQTATVLASTGEAAGLSASDISDYASALSKLVPFEDEAIQSSENLLLTFTNIKGPVFQQAESAILDMSQALGQDLKSSTVQLGKALNDPIKGISALSRVGVAFTDDQKEMIKTMVEAGNVEGAQGVILAELNKEFGGAAVAAGKTFGGQMIILQTAIGNVAEAIGGPLLAGLSNLATAALPAVQAFADDLPASIEGFMAAAEPVVSFLGSAFTGAASGLVTFVGQVLGLATGDYANAWEILGDLPAAFMNTFFPVIQTISDGWATVQQVFSGDWEASDQIDPVVNAIGQLASFVRDDLIPPMLILGDVVSSVFAGDFKMAGMTLVDVVSTWGPVLVEALAGMAQAFLSWIGPIIPPLLQQLLGVLIEIDTWIISTGLPMLVTQLAVWAGAFVDWVAPLIPPLLTELGGLLVQIGSWMLTVAAPAMIANLATWGLAFVEWVAPRIPLLMAECLKLELAIGVWILTQALPSIINQLIKWGDAFVGWVAKDVLPTLPEKLGAVLTGITTWVDDSITSVAAAAGDIGFALLAGIQQGISDDIGRFRSWIESNIGAAIPQWVKDALGIQSPSTVMAKIGFDVTAGLAQGIKQGTGQVGGAVTDVVQAIIDAADKVGIPRLIALALAKAESGLDPTKIGDNGHSVGLFQLHDQGQGAGMSVADRMNPVINATRFLTEAHASLYRQLVAEGYVGDALVETFGRLAEVSDPQYASNYSAALHAVTAEFGNVDLAAVHSAATQKTGVVAAKATTDAICATVAHLPECLTAAGTASSTALVGSLTSGLPTVVLTAQGISKAVVDALAPMPTDVGGVAAAAVRQLSAGLTQGMPEAVGAATLISESVISELDPLPSLAEAIGGDIGEQMAGGIKDATKGAVKAAKSLADQVSDALSSSAIDMLGGFHIQSHDQGGVAAYTGLHWLEQGERTIPPGASGNPVMAGGGGGGGGGDVYFSFPNYVGSRSELMETVKSGLTEYRRTNGRMPWDR